MSDVNVSDDGCGISPAVAYCWMIYLSLFRAARKANEINYK